jgi:hypothetical protein
MNPGKHSRYMTGWMVAAVLGASLLFVSAPRANADDHDKCRHRIEKAEARLHDAIRDHGEHSREAESRRHDLNEERERCWTSEHGWWSSEDHRWHTERDWDRDHDEHDHDDHR